LSPAGQPLAGFGDRLAAYLIDMAILTTIALLVAAPVFMLFFAGWMSDFSAATDPYAAEPDPSVIFSDFIVPLLLLEAGLFLLILAMYYVYYVEMMFRSGQTVGKKVMKLRVVPLNPAATLTRATAAKRYFVEFVGGMLVPILPYLDGLWQLWDKPYQQCLHDKAADTIVIKVRS
jgi:uncharacterized RDD family membrane protein YckC